MYQPKFTITNKILQNIGIIEACREVVQNAPLVPAWEKKFREEAIIRTVHHGTHIEGNELNFSQAARVIEGQTVVARQRDIQEVLNYRNVLDDLEELRTKDVEPKLTEAVVKKIHRLTVEKILPPDQAGTYRATRVVVKNSQTGEVTFTPPAAVEIPYAMEALLAWLGAEKTQEIHPVLRSGIAHYELVRIHPFLDGNGRVARALALLVLFLEDFDVKRFFSLEEYYDRQAGHYYQALQSVGRNNGDLTLWLEYFTEGLAIELDKVKEKVLVLSRDLRLKQKLGGKQLTLTERQMKIMEYIQKVGFLQYKASRELFPMVSDDTVLRELKELLETGIIKKTGVTKASKYILA